MNRAERRRTQKEQLQMKKTISDLKPSEVKLVDICANEKAKKIVQAKMNVIEECVERNISAFICTIFEDKTLNEIADLQSVFLNLAEEDIGKYEKLMKGDIKVAEKTIKELNDKAILRCEELIKDQNINQASAVKILKKEFPEASTSMLTNVYKIKKEEINNKNVSDFTNKLREEVCEKNEIQGLKIKKMIVEGSNGVYEIENNVVTLQDLNIGFDSLEEVEEYKKTEIKKIEDKINEIKQVFNLYKNV